MVEKVLSGFILEFTFIWDFPVFIESGCNWEFIMTEGPDKMFQFGVDVESPEVGPIEWRQLRLKFLREDFIIHYRCRANTILV